MVNLIGFNLPFVWHPIADLFFVLGVLLNIHSFIGESKV